MRFKRNHFIINCLFLAGLFTTLISFGQSGDLFSETNSTYTFKMSVQEYYWLNDDVLVLSARDAGVFSVFLLNIISGGVRTNGVLANMLSNVPGHPPSWGLDWNILPDEQAIVLIDYGPSSASVAMATVNGEIVTPWNQIKAPVGKLYLFSTGKDKSCILVKCAMGETYVKQDITGDSSFLQIPLPDGIMYPIGLVAKDHLLLMDKHLPIEKHVHLVEVELSDKPRVTHDWNLELPFECSVEMAKLSPDGTRLLWKFRDNKKASIWVSDVYAGKFINLGTLPKSDAFGDTFKWSPNGSRISTLRDNQLLIFSVKY